MPVAVGERTDEATGQRWITADVVLAPLAGGDYVIDVELVEASKSQRVLSAIQAVSHPAKPCKPTDQKGLSSATDKAVADMSQLVTKARKVAPEFGRTIDEKMFLLGYVTGIVRFTATRSVFPPSSCQSPS